MSIAIFSLQKKLTYNTIWVLAGKFISILLGLAINILITDLLSQEEVGQYFLLFSLSNIVATVALFGLPKTVIKLITEKHESQTPEKIKHTIALVIQLSSIGVLLALLALSLLFMLNVNMSVNLPLTLSVFFSIIAWFIALSFQQLIPEIFRGYNKILFATLFSGLLSSLILTIYLSISWVLDNNLFLQEIITISAISVLISITISCFILWNKLKVIVPDTNSLTYFDISKITWPIWLTSIVLLVLSQADLWIVGVFLSSEDVAIYGMMSRLIVLISVPLLISNAVVLPLISHLFSLNKNKLLEKTLRFMTTLAVIPSLLMMLVFTFYGEELLLLLFNESYQSGIDILLILAIGQLFNVYAGSCGLTLMFTGHQKLMMLITLFSGTVTIILSLSLAKNYGSIGIALATSFGLILQNILMLFTTRYRVGIWTHADLTLLIRKRRQNEQ